MTILHTNTAKLVHFYGGEANGIFTRLEPSEWKELNPKPDWTKARLSCSSVNLSNMDLFESWVSESSWVPHLDATSTTPALTSTRYIIVTTHGGWANAIGNVVPNSAVAKKKEQKEAYCLSKSATSQAALKGALQAWFGFKRASLGSLVDGRQPMQATREGLFKKGYGSTTSTFKVECVVDMRYASWVMVDELHSYLSKGTLTYSNIISPFLRYCELQRAPGVLGITGTALHNGATPVMMFAEMVCSKIRQTDDNAAVETVASTDFVSISKTI